MNPIYKRESSSTYLILDELPMEGSQYYQLKMIKENKIDHFLDIQICNFNGENQIYYNISGKQTIKCIFEKKEMEAEDILQILIGIKSALEQMENYLLCADAVIINPEYMYIHAATGKLFLCFYPFQDKPIHIAIRELSEYLLNHLNHEDETAVAIGYQFYRSTREENFSFMSIIEEFCSQQIQINSSSNSVKKEEDLLSDEREDKNNIENYTHDLETMQEETEEAAEQKKISKIPVICFFVCIIGGFTYLLYNLYCCYKQADFSLEQFFGTQDRILAAGIILFGTIGFLLLWIYKKILDKEKIEYSNVDGKISDKMKQEFYEISAAGYVDCGEDNNREREDSQIGETILLKENMYKEERLLVEKSKKFSSKSPLHIQLTEFPYIIGKVSGKVDQIIHDKSISRIHAQFIMPDTNTDIVYLQDLNSTNGTYKNGIALEANELVPLTAEDEITFGKVSFTYH